MSIWFTYIVSFIVSNSLEPSPPTPLRRNFLKPTIWCSCPLHTVIGQMLGGEKVGRIWTSLSYVIISFLTSKDCPKVSFLQCNYHVSLMRLPPLFAAFLVWPVGTAMKSFACDRTICCIKQFVSNNSGLKKFISLKAISLTVVKAVKLYMNKVICSRSHRVMAWTKVNRDG